MTDFQSFLLFAAAAAAVWSCNLAYKLQTQLDRIEELLENNDNDAPDIDE